MTTSASDFDSPGMAVIANAVHLATDLRGLQLALNVTVGDRYTVAVRQQAEGVVVALRRRQVIRPSR